MSRGSDAYARRIKGAVQGLWNGALSRDDFVQVMSVTIMDGLEAAFAEGAKECGIEAGDFTDDEMRAINRIVDAETEQVDDFADYIIEHNKGTGSKLQLLLDTRIPMWQLRYMDIVNQGKTMACADKKFKWVLGDTEHCATCAKLAGLVHRGSQWRDYVLPQNPPNDLLECGGWRCGCSLEMTDERASTRYPSLP